METTTALGEARAVDLAELGPGLPGFPGPHGHTEASLLRHRAVQDVEFDTAEGLVLGCALDLHEAVVAGADDVHVGLGLDVFLIGEVEWEHATDDADADRGDRAGERLGLGPHGVPHDRGVGC